MSKKLKKLVIIDDSPVIIEMIKKIVEGIDADLFLTLDYNEAFDYCTTNKVDALISDLNLDDKSGFNLVEDVLTKTDNSEMLSFIMSAESPKIHREKMNELKIKGWIMKPINPQAIKTILLKLVG